MLAKLTPVLTVKHRRYPGLRRKARMTIAAGFPYESGILICSDSQFTIPPAKVDGTKIGWAEPNWGKLMIACAGNVDFATGAYQTCLQKSGTFGTRDALRRFAELLEEYYRRHVFSHPLYEENPGDYEYQFLLGVRFEGDSNAKARLFITSDTVLRETGAFECIGCGVDVAQTNAQLFP